MWPHSCRPSGATVAVLFLCAAGLAPWVGEACPPGQFQTSPLVVSCTGTLDASPPVNLVKYENQLLLQVPEGVPNLRIKLQSDNVDLDLRLIDGDNGECIVGHGCLFSEPCANESDYCISTPDGMDIHFGSQHAMTPFEESIWIAGATTRNLEVVLHATNNGEGVAYFSHGAFSPCPNPVPGCLLPTTTTTATTTATETQTSTTFTSTSTTTVSTTETSSTTASTWTSTLTQTVTATESSITSATTGTSTGTTVTATLTSVTTATTSTSVTSTLSSMTRTTVTSVTTETVTTTPTTLTTTSTGSHTTETMTETTVSTTLTSGTDTSTTTTLTTTHTSVTETKTDTTFTTTATSVSTATSTTLTATSTTTSTSSTTTVTTSTSTTSVTTTTTTTSSTTSTSTCACGDGWIFVGLEPETTVAPEDNSSGVDPAVLAHIVPEGSSLNVAIELIMHSDEVPKGEKLQYICELHAEATEDDNATTTAAEVAVPCVTEGEEHDVALIVVLVIALVLLLLCFLALIALILCLRGEKRRQKFELEDLQDRYEGELRKCRAQLKDERLRLQAREAAAKEVEGRVGTACKDVLDQALSAPWPSPAIKEDLQKAAAVGKAAGPAFLPAERVLEVALKALLAQGEAEAELRAKIEDLETESTTSSLNLAVAGREKDEAVEQAQAEAKELRARAGSLESQLAEANEERKVLEAARADLKQKVLDTCTETSRENEKSRKLLHGRINDLAAQVERLSGDLDAARAERDSLRQRAGAGDKNSHQNAEDDRSVLRVMLQGAEDRRSRLEQELADGQGRVEEMAKRIEVAEKEKASAEQHLAACTKHIAGLRSAAQQREQHQAEELAALERRLTHQAGLVESLTAHNGEADRLVAKLRAEIQQREARLARWHEVGLHSIGRKAEEP